MKMRRMMSADASLQRRVGVVWFSVTMKTED